MADPEHEGRLSLSLSHAHTHTTYTNKNKCKVLYAHRKVFYGKTRIDLPTLTLFKDALSSGGLGGVARKA
jgi:hypothetical protein